MQQLNMTWEEKLAQTEKMKEVQQTVLGGQGFNLSAVKDVRVCLYGDGWGGGVVSVYVCPAGESHSNGVYAGVVLLLPHRIGWTVWGTGSTQAVNEYRTLLLAARCWQWGTEPT